MARYTALRAAKSQRTIGAFADLHRNEAMVVCGCGTSLNDLDRTNERVTVGVNDVGRAFTPSYLVVVDGPDRIAADRWEYVRVTNADVLFTNQFLRLDHPFIVRMALRETPEPMLPQRTSVHVLGKPWYSPYVALSVAAHLGGDPIGLIGVDFAEDHFFGATGPYPGTRHLPLVDEQFRILRGALVAAGQRVANLSTRSRVTAFPRLDLMDFDRLPPRTVRRDRRPNLNVVVYDQDASVVNGWLARCIWAETGHSARFVHGAPGGDPLVWPDLDWTAHPEAVREELTRADIVLTASPVLPEHEDIIADHPQVRLRVAGEGPALRLGHSIVPLALPLWSQRLAPDDRDGIYTVMLAPGGHRESLRAAVESAAEAARTPIRVVDVERDTPAEASKLRRRADILIDPGANGTWTWSMAGLAAGSIVVNGLASSSQALQHLRLFAGIPGTPFEHASGDRLALVLRRVLASTPTALKARGTDGRRWIQQHWSFASHWDRWWLPPIAAAFRAGIRDVPDE
jgi:hypothetical protein